jgi:NADP-dependent 3-hydroxy acid dehydrogenase YdfG
MIDSNKVWFIPGTSKGFRLSLVKTLLNEGYRVAVTTNDLDSLKDFIGYHHACQWLPLEIKAKDAQSEQQAVLETIRHFGQIDIIVNNPRLWKKQR